MDERDVRDFLWRDRYTRGYRQSLARHLTLMAGAVATGAAGAAVTASNLAWGLVAAVAMATAAVAPIGALWLIGRLAAPILRAACLTFWIRTAWLLHAPWLAVLVWGLLAFVAASIDRIWAFRLLEGLVGLSFGFWGLGSLCCLLGWFELWHGTRAELGLRRAGMTAAVGLLGLLTFTVAVAIGSVLGGAVLHRTMDWAHP